MTTTLAAAFKEAEAKRVESFQRLMEQTLKTHSTKTDAEVAQLVWAKIGLSTEGLDASGTKTFQGQVDLIRRIRAGEHKKS